MEDEDLKTALESSRQRIDATAGRVEWLLADGQGGPAVAQLARALPCGCPRCVFDALIGLAGATLQHVPWGERAQAVEDAMALLPVIGSVRRNPRADRVFMAREHPAEIPSKPVLELRTRVPDTA